jgi:hypothetical protein
LAPPAELAAQAGRGEAAMSYLNRAEALPDPGMLAVGSDRWLDPLRGRADFRALLQRLGFVFLARSLGPSQ